MQLRPGSLLIAHPVHGDPEHNQHVVLISESDGSVGTMGLILNQKQNLDMRSFMNQRDWDWSETTPVFYGGDVGPSSLVMLHSEEWCSTTTIPITNTLSISSDELMIEKLGMGNYPNWFKLFLGCKWWDPTQLESEVRPKKAKWLVLSHPSDELVEGGENDMWNRAVAECGHDLFKDYL